MAVGTQVGGKVSLVIKVQGILGKMVFYPHFEIKVDLCAHIFHILVFAQILTEIKLEFVIFVFLSF